MNRKNILLIVLFSGLLFLLSFMTGYKVMNYRANKESEDLDEKIKNSDVGLEILVEEDTISPNTNIVLKTYYTDCKHTISNFKSAADETVNMTREQYEKYILENQTNIKIISFSNREIVLREEKDHLCPNHYIIGESNGYIAIYGIDENGKKYLDKVFKDYPISLLKEVDQERLKEGIIVDSEEELTDVLENFIS